MRKFANLSKTMLPISIVVIIFVVFSIITGGRTLTGKNLSNVLQQSFSIVIGGFGMMFVMSMGSIDMSLGSIILISGIGSIFSVMNLGFIPMFIMSALIGASFGLLSGSILAFFKMPSFMVTIGLSFSLRGLGNFICQKVGNGMVLSQEARAFDTLGFKLPFVIVLALIAIYLFEYTKFGIRCKAIGENELACQMSGINTKRIKILAFMLSGAFAGIAGMFVMARTGGVTNTLGGGYEMRVMLGLFLGGVPVNGGFDAKMYRVLIGAPAVLLLENGMALTGISGGAYQLLEGIALLIVIILTTILQKRSVTKDEIFMAKAKIASDGK